jgi:spore germination protein GerM
VSRSLAGNADAPRALFESFAEGPKDGGGLLKLVPNGTEIRSLSMDGGQLQLELSEHFLQANLPLVVPALWHTMRSLPDVQKMLITVAGKDLALPPADRRMLFFYSLSQSRLVSVPVNARSHMEALKLYLQGTGDASLIGLPADVQMLGYEIDPIRSSLALNFSFTPSLRQLGTEQPESTRSLLLGLIATLTQFPEIETVTLEFDGHSRLGLGECASLIGTPQTQPTVLNDERLFRS